MPKGPKGEKRPADVIGAAVIVQKLRDEGFIQIDAGGSGSAQGGDG